METQRGLRYGWNDKKKRIQEEIKGKGKGKIQIQKISNESKGEKSRQAGNIKSNSSGDESDHRRIPMENLGIDWR